LILEASCNEKMEASCNEEDRTVNCNEEDRKRERFVILCFFSFSIFFLLLFFLFKSRPLNYFLPHGKHLLRKQEEMEYKKQEWI
jgi:hypothetical protein